MLCVALRLTTGLPAIWFLLVSVALAHRSPAEIRRLFGVGRRFDLLHARPGQFFFSGETTAMFPAGFGAAAAAGVLLARERLAGTWAGGKSSASAACSARAWFSLTCSALAHGPRRHRRARSAGPRR